MAALTASQAEAVDDIVAAVSEHGDAEDALRRCLATLHRLAGDGFDAGPAVRQAATVALADVRDIAEGTYDFAAASLDEGGVAEGETAPWPTELPDHPDAEEISD